jgi:hypothetical protein
MMTGPWNRRCFGMTSAEGLVLVSATLLVLGVMVEGGKGTLSSRAGALLLAF